MKRFWIPLRRPDGDPRYWVWGRLGVSYARSLSPEPTFRVTRFSLETCEEKLELWGFIRNWEPNLLRQWASAIQQRRPDGWMAERVPGWTLL